MVRNSFRADAARFFEWCRFDLNTDLERIDPALKRDFESGKISEKMLNLVCMSWSTHLKTHLLHRDQSAAFRKALPNRQDYARFMNCLIAEQHKLPKRILTAVAKESQHRAKETEAAFFTDAGVAR